MSRALIVHGDYQDMGGAENFSLRVAAILQGRFDEVVILHHGSPPALDHMRSHIGIALDPKRVIFLQVRQPWWLSALAGSGRNGFVLLQYAEIVRTAQTMFGQFDLAVVTFAEAPLKGENVIQLLHIPMLASDAESIAYCGIEMPWPRRQLQALYLALVKRYMGWRENSLDNVQVVANSHWSADQFRRHYPRARIIQIHHGVHVSLSEEDAGWVPFEARQNNFVMIGRMVPAKRIEDGIEIVERLRGCGHDVGLRIVGNGPDGYVNHISRLAAERPWLTLHFGLSRADLEALVVRQKWGLHCYQFEHYGLAPGEMQALGCITFVHNSGGQREIVMDVRQRYTDIASAITKIDTVMRNPEIQKQLLAKGATSTAAHVSGLFDRHFGAIIDAVPGLSKKAAS